MRIAFVDHQIDNWHANRFACLLKEHHPEVRLTGVYANEKGDLSQWSRQNGAQAVDCIRDLADLADAVMILAPSNPETHWELCRQVFPLGKPVYIDKTFAPDYDTAKRIFAEADRLGVPIQTSSVLRYSEVQSTLRSLEEEVIPLHMAVWAPGDNFHEYLIHSVELVISVMGPLVKDVSYREVAGFHHIELQFAGERMAVIHFQVEHATPYFAVVTTSDKWGRPIAIDSTHLFRNGLEAIVAFFRDPSTAIDRRETLAIMKTLDQLWKTVPDRRR